MKPRCLPVCAFALVTFLSSPPLDAGEAITRGDVLSLMDEGRISTEVIAAGAHKVTVKVQNLTSHRVEVEFPPGLVADAFAEFPLLQIGGGGGQSLSLMDGPMLPLEAEKIGGVAIAACCLNYGVPEPTARSVMFLKRAEEFTSDPVLVFLIRELATAGVDRETAQAALWHVTDRMSWQKLSRIGAGRGPQKFTQEELVSAKRWIDEATLRASQEVDPSAFTEGTEHAFREAKSARMTVLLHSHPKSTRLEPSFVRDVARELRALLPECEVAHRNTLLDPADKESAAWQWCVFLQSKTGPKGSAATTGRRFAWDPLRERWQATPILRSTHRAEADEEADAAWVAQRLRMQIGAQNIPVKFVKRPKPSLHLQSYLPYEATSVTIADPRKPEESPITLAINVPNGRIVTHELDEASAAKVAALRTPVVVGFELKKE